MTDRIVGSAHNVAVCVGNRLESSVARLVSVGNERSVSLAVYTDTLKVVEGVVGEDVLHSVPADYLCHIVEAVV